MSIKHDVRDYILARYPDGGPGHRYHVFVRKQFKEDGKTLLGRGSLAEEIKKQSGIDSDDMKEVLCPRRRRCEAFGAVYSVRARKTVEPRKLRRATFSSPVPCSLGGLIHCTR